MPSSISIIYFSGTSNTEIVTHLIADELRKENNVEVLKVEDILKQKIECDLTKYDMLGIGYPIHGFDVPRIIYDFVKTLNKISEGKKAFIFSTSAGPMYLNDIASHALKRKLKRKGYSVFYERQFYMPANIATPYNDEVCKQLYNAAVVKTKKMAEEISINKERIRNDSIIVRLLFAWLYILEKTSWRTLSKDFKVLESCNLCEKCVELCPKSNISIKNGRIKFGWNCLACYRCVYSCPKRAITGRLYKIAILKDGYDLKRIIEDDQIKGDYITEKTRGYYRIFRKYLANEDR